MYETIPCAFTLHVQSVYRKVTNMHTNDIGAGEKYKPPIII